MTQCLFLVFLMQAVSGFETMSVRFERELISELGERDVSKGTIFYRQSDAELVVRVTYPISQVMVIVGKTLLLYYPDQKSALEIKSSIPLSLPFVATMVAPYRANYGLTEMGFQLSKTERRGDTLASMWNAPAKGQGVVGNFKLVEFKRRLVLAESFKPDGQIATKALFSNYRKIGNSNIALEVVTTGFKANGIEIEKLNFQDPHFNEPIPDSIMNFHIPPGTPVKHVQW
ncbi:MAG: hypothetical protein NTV54_08235 [Ignavibacteriales bacterium]|nr:hypothetical protein [Ignavibacteriales bacterium]